MIRSSSRTAVRHERAAPDDLVHMDVKKVGRMLQTEWVLTARLHVNDQRTAALEAWLDD